MVGNKSLNGLKLLGAVREIFGGVLTIEKVEDVVFDCRGDGGWLVAINCNSLVNFLERKSVTIEFTICDEIGEASEDRLDLFVQMCENFVVPKVLIAGLESRAVAECADSVELGLDVERVGKGVSILLHLKG